MAEWILLILALSFDAFLVSVTYGLDEIRISRSAAVIIALIGTLFLFVSLTLANTIGQFLDERLALSLSGALLMFLGCCSLFQSLWKSCLEKLQKQPICLRYKNVVLLLEIAQNEIKADVDRSKTLSYREAIMLAMALSFDSLASGFAYGLSIQPNLGLYGLNFIVCWGLVLLGASIGAMMKGRTRWDLSWCSGVFLIILAFARLL